VTTKIRNRDDDLPQKPCDSVSPKRRSEIAAPDPDCLARDGSGRCSILNRHEIRAFTLYSYVFVSKLDCTADFASASLKNVRLS